MAVEEEAVAVLAVLAVVLDLQAVRLAHLAVLAGPPVALLEVRDQQAAALQGLEEVLLHRMSAAKQPPAAVPARPMAVEVITEVAHLSPTRPVNHRDLASPHSCSVPE